MLLADLLLHTDVYEFGSVIIHLSDPESQEFNNTISRFRLLLHSTALQTLWVLLNYNAGVIIHLSDSEKCRFDANIDNRQLFLRIKLLHPYVCN